MANLDLCLACGTANKRRIVTDQPSILFVWKFILMVQLNANPSKVDCIIVIRIQALQKVWHYFPTNISIFLYTHIISQK